MTEKEITQMNWKEFDERFSIRVEKGSSKIWIVPRIKHREVELRLEQHDKCFSFCFLSKEEVEKFIEKLQKVLKEIEP